MNLHTTDMQLTEATCLIRPLPHRRAAVHVRITGTLARTDAPAMCRRLSRLIDLGVRHLDLDVGDLLAIDRACLAVLVSAVRRLRGAGGTLRFSGLSGECERRFRQLHLFVDELAHYGARAVA